MTLNYRFEFKLLGTGIGSMPHTEPSASCELILENMPEIPFWPQLPKLSFNENMYVQFAYDLPGAVINIKANKLYIDTERKALSELDSFYNKISKNELNYDRKYFAGFYAMTEKLNLKKGTAPKLLKGQVTGPISLGLQLVDNYGKTLLYDELYLDIIIKALNQKVKKQEKILKCIAEPVIFFDEPSLCLFGTPYLNLSREKITRALTEVCAGLKCLKGVHCCGNTDWSLLLELPIDILSFDAYNYAERLALYSESVKNFIARDGTLAFGIVPSVEDNFRAESLDSLALKFEHALHYFTKKGISEKQLLSSSLLTPSCGLAGMSVESAEKALKTTKELSEILRKRHGLE